MLEALNGSELESYKSRRKKSGVRRFDSLGMKRSQMSGVSDSSRSIKTLANDDRKLFQKLRTDNFTAKASSKDIDISF